MERFSGTVEFDEFGLVKNPRDWTPELAEELARHYDIGPLGDEHWAFIKSLREYYERYHVPPPAHLLCREMHLPRGCGHELFHSCLDAWRIAGLPDPGEEAKSYLSAE
jgi:tRNA 2-thiouridine synthesizing protein E